MERSSLLRESEWVDSTLSQPLGGKLSSDLKGEFERERKARKATLSAWHSGLGHLRKADLKKIPGVKGDERENIVGECDNGAEGKLKQLNYPKGEGVKATDVLHRIHSDVVGPISLPSLGGNRLSRSSTNTRSFSPLSRSRQKQGLKRPNTSMSVPPLALYKWAIKHKRNRKPQKHKRDQICIVPF